MTAPVSPLAQDLSLERIEAGLRAHPPAVVPREVAPKRAAVAALLRYPDLDPRAAPEVLLMKRAEREGDRWSGHVSLPGGGAQATDRDLFQTAVRETREEVGVDLLRAARPIGQLDEHLAIAKGRLLPMAITPFVLVATAPIEPALGDEAEATFWLPLGLAASRALSGTFEYRLGPVPIEMPCWRWQSHVVWGMTYKMLTQLLDRVLL